MGRALAVAAGGDKMAVEEEKPSEPVMLSVQELYAFSTSWDSEFLTLALKKVPLAVGKAAREVGAGGVEFRVARANDVVVRVLDDLNCGRRTDETDPDKLVYSMRGHDLLRFLGEEVPPEAAGEAQA
jgi:hypothetical protein